MAVLIFIAALAIIIGMVVQGERARKERDAWILGTKYIPKHGEWHIAKLASDPYNIEFRVRFNRNDGFYYDEDSYGYQKKELKIKRDDTKPIK